MTPNELPIHHGFNFRDLGGYPTKAGQTVASNRLIRSGRLNELSTRDQAFLADYGLKVDVDFRSPEERADSPDRLPAGVDYQFTPVFPTDETKVTKSQEEKHTELAQDPLAGFRSMVKTYAAIVQLPSAKKSLPPVL